MTICAGETVNAEAHVGPEGVKARLHERVSKGTKITIADFPWPHTRLDEVMVQGSIAFSGGPNLSGLPTELARNITVCDQPDIVGYDYAKTYRIKQ